LPRRLRVKRFCQRFKPERFRPSMRPSPPWHCGRSALHGRGPGWRQRTWPGP
jgi:hypothetical protein